MSSMGLGSKMSAEMGLLAFMALLGCFEAPTFVRALPTRSAIMRAPGPAPLSPHAVCAAASVDRLQAAGRAAVLLLPASSLFASVDVLYLLPLRDKVRSRSLEPASVRTPLTSVDRGERALRAPQAAPRRLQADWSRPGGGPQSQRCQPRRQGRICSAAVAARTHSGRSARSVS